MLRHGIGMTDVMGAAGGVASIPYWKNLGVQPGEAAATRVADRYR